MLLVEISWSETRVIWEQEYSVVMESNGIYEGILGLNSFKLYRLLEHSLVIRRLLGTPGSVPKHHGCRFSHS